MLQTPPVITLGPDEVAVAELVGTRRNQSCLAAGSAPKFDNAADLERQNQHAAGAEIACCKALGGWWAAIGGKGHENAGADILVNGNPAQVRWSKYEQGFLIVYENDPGDQPFLFVTGLLPTFKVVGWIHGSAAKDPSRWHTTNPRTGKPLGAACYIVEQHDLAPLQPVARAA